MLPHIWWGVSIQNRKDGIPRIKDLCAASARVCFLPIEPLLEDLGDISLDAVSWVIAARAVQEHGK
jgi:protein gp37